MCRIKKLSWIIAIFVFGVSLCPAQEMPVSTDLQYQFLLKILTFDRNLETRIGDEIVIGILYQSKFRLSEITKNSLVSSIEKSSIKTLEDIPIRYVNIDLNRENNLAGVLSGENVDILYIAPLRAFNLKPIIELSQSNKILTFTGVPEYTEDGIGIGIGIKGNNPQIIINLNSSQLEGCDFSSKLLNLARIIR